MESTQDEFDVVQFEKRLNNLKDTQDSIQTVSAWCLKNRVHHKKIVSSWLNVLKQVRIEQRLTLFHLANDVIQYSKRKHYEFVGSWGTTLQKATTMVRDEKIKNKILRIFKIWEQRGIYNEEFLADLNGLLSISNKKPPPPQPQSLPKDKDTQIDPDDFQSNVLVSNIQDCVKLESETDKIINLLAKSAHTTNLENIKLTVKDRDHVEEVDKEIAESLKNFEKAIKCLNSEIKARNVLITAIEQAEVYYSTQRGDVKVVANAYRNFGNRIKNMKKKLEELQTSLPSPIPSPDINAPSPEPDSDFILPDENNYFPNQANMSNMMGYIGSSKLPFDINDFNSDSDSQRYEGDTVQPIQVINTRPKEEPAFNINDFFKNYLADSSYGGPPIAPVPPPTSFPASNYQPPQNISNTYQPQPNPSNNFTNPPNNSNNFPSTGVNQGGTYSQPPNPSTSYQPPPQPVPPLNYQPPIIENIPGYVQNHPTDYQNTQPVLPLLPPPLPPALDHNDPYNSLWEEPNFSWNTSQDSNNFDDLIDDPVSPTHYDRKGINTNLVECTDNNRSEIGDIDHRQLNISSIPENIKSLNRNVDIDHRNLIALTGSPVPKTTEESVPPPPVAPPLLWSSDMDFRNQMTIPPPPHAMTISQGPLSEEVDQDYRIPPSNIPNIQVNVSNSNMNPPSSTPLEPPPLHDMDEFLKPPAKVQEENESPTKNAIIGRNMKNPMLKNIIKGQNGRDNVESVDMEMSDDDVDENSFMNSLQHNSSFNNVTPVKSSPNLNQSCPGTMLNPTKYGNNNQSFANQNQWNSNPNLGNNNWPMNSPTPPHHHNSPNIGGPRGPPLFFPNRPFPPQLNNNFRGNMRGGSPYFPRPRGTHPPPAGPFRGKNNFRGKLKRGGLGPW